MYSRLAGIGLPGLYVVENLYACSQQREPSVVDGRCTPLDFARHLTTSTFMSLDVLFIKSLLQQKHGSYFAQ
jgi:hypothetical protein